MTKTGLLFTSQPYFDESLAGFIIRLAELNHYDSPNWILALSNLPRRNSFNLNFAELLGYDLSGLSQITGVQENILLSLSFPPNPTEWMEKHRRYFCDVFNNRVLAFSILRKNNKICPKCLLEMNYHRKIWDIALLTTCPIHNCILLDTCPCCKKKIMWSRPAVSKCKCKYDWREVPCNSLEEQEIVLSQQIYYLCGYDIKTNVDVLGHNNPILHLDLEHLLKLISLLGARFMKDNKSQRGTYLGVSRSNAKVHSILVEVVTLLNGYPSKFYQFFDELKATEMQRLSRKPWNTLLQLYSDFHYMFVPSDYIDPSGQCYFLEDIYQQYQKHINDTAINEEGNISL